MKLFTFFVVNIVETLLRVFPFPCKTGLITIGNPDQKSPVFLTGNYHLTVERVKRRLRGINAYLLIANSKGVNVWCAAAGGLLTNHDVISVLRTSAIEELVDHRNVIMPQLAAAGVEAQIIQKKTGWKVIWGPVYAKDVTRFIRNRLVKTEKMCEVEFSWKQRIEMAVAWAFPISVIGVLIMFLFWQEAISSYILFVWGISFLIFLSFPLYNRWLCSDSKLIGCMGFDFGRWKIQIILLIMVILGLVVYSILVGNFGWGTFCVWSFLSLVIVLLLSIDLMGSTPVYKSGLHDDRLLKIIIDKDKCKGAGFCKYVCPRNCYKVDTDRHSVEMLKAHRCVQCGACIVQCPFDALYFKNPKGEIIFPETIRRYKLNLLGKRLVSVEGKIS
ncbi:MAG: HgcAB-like fusion protein [Thermodesulfobacteriota bacterium]|nr:HgcAB-like fusion protein [Thermodesulfobacteriota bacterium]